MASISIPYELNHLPIIHHHHNGPLILRPGVDRQCSNPDRIAAFRRSSSRKMPRISATTSAANSSVFAQCSVNRRSNNDGVDWTNSNRNRTATFRRPSSRRKLPRISATATAANSSSIAQCSVYSRPGKDGVLFSETIDEWMRDSTAEIVRNLRKAPLLVQIYANNDGSAEKLETEKAIADEWPAVTRKWKDGEVPPPDGVILVEELAGDETLKEGEENGTRAWGLLVQGKGAECGPVCYLMKTSRVGSGMGSGCTHFCLMKAEGFRESALSQLTNSWLLR